MIRIDFAEPDLLQWKKWRQKCAKLQQALNDSYTTDKPETISDTLYKEQKGIYLGLHGLFYGKCAYCETLIAENHPGDIDHFRPKKRVTDSSHHCVTVKHDSGQEIPHPGYYWLAYDFQNLLPACEDCNRPNKSKTSGQQIGKWDKFPVRGFRAYMPGDEIHEEPLLLNPTLDDIEKHLAITDSGIVVYFSPEGKTCTEVFGLNKREALIQRRKEAYNAGYDAVSQFVFACLLKNDQEAERHFTTMEEFESGKKPYSAAGRAGIKAKLNELQPSIKKLFGSVQQAV